VRVPETFESVTLDSDGDEEEVNVTDIARQWAPVAFVYFLWVSILINTQMLITNTIEEKSNKLIEVLLPSISPIVIMGGKIIGIAATGLTIVFSWMLMVPIGRDHDTAADRFNCCRVLAGRQGLSSRHPDDRQAARFHGNTEAAEVPGGGWRTLWKAVNSPA